MGQNEGIQREIVLEVVLDEKDPSMIRSSYDTVCLLNLPIGNSTEMTWTSPGTVHIANVCGIVLYSRCYVHIQSQVLRRLFALTSTTTSRCLQRHAPNK